MITSSSPARQAPSKRDRTRRRLVDAALDLCEEHGFERVTVSQIAAAAGVSEMTFFRHFPTKESVVLDDPYDPLIASQVAAQPRHWVPLRRAAEGMRAAWQSLPVPEEQDTRRRIRILAASPALRAASWRNNEETQEILTQALVAGGAPEIDARVAAAACLAAITEALMAWAGDDATSMDACITRALDVLAHGAAE